MSEDQGKVKLYRTGDFPYITPQDTGELVAEVTPEQAEAIRQKAVELGEKYQSFKQGFEAPGMEGFEDEREALANATAAVSAAKEAFTQAMAAASVAATDLRTKVRPILEEIVAERGTDMPEFFEQEKRRGQQAVCAEMAEAFPEVFADHPKYKAVAAGTPKKAEEALAGYSDSEDDEKGDD